MDEKKTRRPDQEELDQREEVVGTPEDVFEVGYYSEITPNLANEEEGYVGTDEEKEKEKKNAREEN